MFLNPSTMTVGDLRSTVRDGAFILGLIFGVWKARGAIQPAIDFFKDAKATMVRGREHMDVMEQGMADLQTGLALVLTNHLPHMQKEMKRMTKRHVRLTDMLAAAGISMSEESPEEVVLAAEEPALAVPEAVVES
jgi:hypothetical protein